MTGNAAEWVKNTRKIPSGWMAKSMAVPLRVVTGPNAIKMIGRLAALIIPIMPVVFDPMKQVFAVVSSEAKMAGLVRYSTSLGPLLKSNKPLGYLFSP